MLAIKFSVLILCCIILEQLCSVCGQQLPPVSCPQYFQYQHDGFGYFGKITLPQWPVGMSELRVHTSQQGVPTSKYYGRLMAYPTDQAVVRNVLERKGADFRVHFADPGNPPKLTLISLDDRILCRGTDYPPPNSGGLLSYTLSTYYIDANGYAVNSLVGPFKVKNVIINSDPPMDTAPPLTTTVTPAELYQPISTQATAPTSPPALSNDVRPFAAQANNPFLNSNREGSGDSV